MGSWPTRGPTHLVLATSIALLGGSGLRWVEAETMSPMATAARVTTVRVDGVLDDHAWTLATPIGPLVQRVPVEGSAPSEETEVRVVFDDDNLYFGVVCRDRTPSAIVSTQLGRDADLGVDDSITIVLDPFLDNRNGFFFSINPAGARSDGQISNNAPWPSLDWDGIWDARAHTTTEGWVAEIAIPFKTLRFRAGQTVWGMNFERQIKRLQEEDRWAGARFDVWITNLAEAGELTGLEGVQQGRGLDIRPYASGGEGESEWEAKVGLDVVKSITPGLTASVTVNTDFAETEVDARQINLTRFPLFFPEKRTFFLEGAGVFDVAGLAGGGPPGGGPGGPPADLLPFYSRRIGLYQGEEVPILFGIKVSGRQSGFNVGVLDVETRATTLYDGELPAQNLLAARLSRNLFAQSWVGVIATHGDPTGGGDNTLLGFDARFATSRFGGDKNLSLDLFALRTDDSALGEADGAYGLQVDYPNDLFSASLGFKHIGEHFRPALGFVPRTGIRKLDGRLAFQPRPGRFGMRQVSFEANPSRVTSVSGDVEDWDVFIVLPRIEFDSGDAIMFGWRPSSEQLTEPFPVRPEIEVPSGTYRSNRFQVEVESASKRIWVVQGELEWGDFYGGSLRSWEGGLILKPSTHFALEFELRLNSGSLPGGDFEAHIYSGRIEYRASPNVSWSNLIQYDSDSRILGFQSRFRWILRPGNDLFVVARRGWYQELDGDLVPSFDAGSVKLQYTIRL